MREMTVLNLKNSRKIKRNRKFNIILIPILCAALSLSGCSAASAVSAAGDGFISLSEGVGDLINLIGGAIFTAAGTAADAASAAFDAASDLLCELTGLGEAEDDNGADPCDIWEKAENGGYEVPSGGGGTSGGVFFFDRDSVSVAEDSEEEEKRQKEEEKRQKEEEEERRRQREEEEQYRELEKLEDERSYCFSQLDSDSRRIYIQIYNCFLQMETDTLISTFDSELVDKCFNFVMMDHPELFFVKGYSIKTTTRDDIPVKMEISGSYIMDEQEREEAAEKIRAKADEILSGVPSWEGEYEQVKYIFDYLVENTEYDITAPNNQNIASVFIDGRSVCQGYSMATKYLLDKLGIFCTIVYGETEGESHAWNLVRMDGVYCYVDTTWGDTFREEISQGPERISYNYFGCNDEILKNTHEIINPSTLPQCLSLSEYYYVREGLYFNSCDMERFGALMFSRIQEGSEYFTIRCSNRSVYDTFVDTLFTNKGIFNYLEEGKTAHYIKDDRECTITFIDYL